jgi:hypothetical protein
VPARSRLLSDEQIAAAARFYRAGATLPGIAGAYGCSSDTVRVALIAAGVPMHARKEPRILLTVWGETKSIAGWAEDERCPVSKNTLRQRVAAGWGHERAVSLPPVELNGFPRWPRPVVRRSQN